MAHRPQVFFHPKIEHTFFIISRDGKNKINVVSNRKFEPTSGFFHPKCRQNKNSIYIDELARGFLFKSFKNLSEIKEFGFVMATVANLKIHGWLPNTLKEKQKKGK